MKILGEKWFSFILGLGNKSQCGNPVSCRGGGGLGVELGSTRWQVKHFNFSVTLPPVRLLRFTCPT